MQNDSQDSEQNERIHSPVIGEGTQNERQVREKHGDFQLEHAEFALGGVLLYTDTDAVIGPSCNQTHR